MTFFHGRWRRRVALLAAGALDAGEVASVRRHMQRCRECASDWAALVEVWELLGRDPAAQAEPAVSPEVLAGRVKARIDAGARAAWAPARLLPAGLAAAAVVIAVSWAVSRWASQPQPPAEAAQVIEIPADMLARMERRLARESTARYLTEARDVLVTVASRPEYCNRQERRVDLSDETQRSRDLLARRALLVDAEAPEVASARQVLDDVERTLRDVVSLDPCAEPGALATLRAEMQERRLLLKIDIVSRELMG